MIIIMLLWLLNAGCGTGNYASALSPYVGKITGIEYNPGMFKQAKAKTANLKNIELLQGDGTNIVIAFKPIAYA